MCVGTQMRCRTAAIFTFTLVLVVAVAVAVPRCWWFCFGRTPCPPHVPSKPSLQAFTASATPNPPLMSIVRAGAPVAHALVALT